MLQAQDCTAKAERLYLDCLLLLLLLIATRLMIFNNKDAGFCALTLHFYYNTFVTICQHFFDNFPKIFQNFYTS